MPDDTTHPAPSSAPQGSNDGAPSTPDTSTPSVPEPSGGEAFSGLGTDFDDGDIVEVNLRSRSGRETAPGSRPPSGSTSRGRENAASCCNAACGGEAAGCVSSRTGPKDQQGAPASPPSEPRTLVEQITQNRGAIMDELAQTRFAWDPGEQKQFTDALEQDASKALVEWAPKIMARMYYESATMALNHINQFTPVLVANYNKLLDQQKEAENTFFKQFPALNKQQHWNDILQFAGVFGKQPNITQADLLAMVGAAVMAKNKLSMGAPAANGGAPPRKPSTPPFVPAQAGGSSVRVVTEPEIALCWPWRPLRRGVVGKAR